VLRGSQWVHSENRFYKFDDYCFAPPRELLEVRSSLPIESVAATDRKRFERNEALDSQILGFLGQPGFQDDSQVETIAAGTFLAKERSTETDALKAAIQLRLTNMAEGPRALVQAASPYRLTEFGNVARRTGLGSIDIRWIVRELEGVLNVNADAFATMRYGNELDEYVVKSMISLTLLAPSNFLDSFAIRARSKDLFGVPISTLEKDIGGFLSAVERNLDTRATIREAIRDADLEFIWRWINGASFADLAEFFLRRTNPTQAQIDQAIQEAIHTVERYAELLNWSVYYITLLLQYLAKEKGLQPASPELGNLAHYVRWGVNHPISVFVRETLEWGSREDALALRDLNVGEVSYTANRPLFRAALETTTDERLTDLLGDPNKVQELRSILHGGRND
jgi:hypothetical protein